MADFYRVPKVHKESIEKAMNLSPQPLANFWSKLFDVGCFEQSQKIFSAEIKKCSP